MQKAESTMKGRTVTMLFVLVCTLLLEKADPVSTENTDNQKSIHLLERATSSDCCDFPGKPAHGRVQVQATGSTYTTGTVARFSCLTGYRLTGADYSVCTARGWSHSVAKVTVTCRPCPKNEYKSGLNNSPCCTRCPANTVTKMTACSDVKQCVCKSGYRGPAGGPCELVLCPMLDKAAHSKAMYGSNQVGARYLVKCPAGYILDNGSSEITCKPDGKWSGTLGTCLGVRHCPLISLPVNGGVVCMAEDSRNAVKCQIKCNRNMEHLLRTNDFDSCGPYTEFKWTNEITNPGRVDECIREVAPGVRMLPAYRYFPSRCDQLNATQKTQVKTQFVDHLKKRGACKDYSELGCSIGNSIIFCGPISNHETTTIGL